MKLRISNLKFQALNGCAAALAMLAPMLSLGADVSSTSTNSILNSRPPPEEIPPLRPPHAEIPPTFWEQHGWSVGIGSVVLVTLAGAALWQLLRPRPEPVVPPEVQARRALEQMRHEGETGAQLSRISQVLRRYVAAAFDLPPEELTTTEFCAALVAKTQIGSELSSALGQFLRESDERKFAPSASPGGFNAATRALELVARAEARCAQLRQAALGAEAPLSKSQ